MDSNGITIFHGKQLEHSNYPNLLLRNNQIKDNDENDWEKLLKENQMI